jgi:hypothetical protein
VGRRADGEQQLEDHRLLFLIWVDNRLREELSYCVPLGIPHSVFTGRVVRPGVDPEWTEEDQDKVLAWNREQSKVCPSCRSRRDLWHQHDKSNPPYMGQLDVCPGCELLAQERRNIPEGADHIQAYIVPTELAEDPDEELTG